MLEQCQKGDCNITAWIEWYLDCILRSIQNAEEMLSSILNKAIFWQNNAQTILNDRQKQVLNIYLDGYIGKLTTKKWAKLSEVSIDTAARDIKHLTDAGILIPQNGKYRNINYGIAISKDIVYTPCADDDE